MTLIGDILGYKSLSIVGLEKNTGKTECLNYVLRNLPEGLAAAVTSIGTDGERKDVVTGTRKPEIYLRCGTIFATTEKYYLRRRLVAEVLDVGDEGTSVGRIITARALSGGKVMLSGPPSTAGLRRWISSLERHGVEFTLIDGALSRLSPASPAVSEAMILATGAALSADMKTLVRETAHAAAMVALPLAEEEDIERLAAVETGVWSIGKDGSIRSSGAGSSLSVDGLGSDFLDDCRAVYVAGALTERFLDMLRADTRASGIEVIVRDFTKIFVSSRGYNAFVRQGGRIAVLQRSKLLAVTVNPTAPNGIVMDSDTLREHVAEAVDVPVYDIIITKEIAMDKLSIMRDVRNFMWRAFLINIGLVLACWIFVKLGLMQYFTWALPGFAQFDVTFINMFIMQLVSIVDIAGVVLFLVPTLALSWMIGCEKGKVQTQKKRK